MLIENLGLVKSANISDEKLTVFTGKNNTGKTYSSYFIYGVLSYLKSISFDFIDEEFIKKSFFESDKKSIKIQINYEDIEKIVIRKVSQELNKNLKKIAVDTFKLKESEFEKLNFKLSDDEIIRFYKIDTNFKNEAMNTPKKFNYADFLNIEMAYNVSGVDIEILILKEEFSKTAIERICTVIINDGILNPPNNIFYIPAERTGINVFKNELNESRLRTYDTMMNTFQFASLKQKNSKIEKKVLQEQIELILGTSKSSYPKPISDYINFLNNMNNKPEMIATEIPSDFLRNEILEGKYEINDDDDSVSFRHRYGRKMYRTKTIPFHVASSSIKSLFGLDYFLDHVGSSGDYLIIDEPELSLHYKNQKKLALFFYELIKIGYKVILSTHSDILIRELTNLVLKSKLSEDYRSDMEKDIKIYNFINGEAVDLGPITEINNFENFDSTSSEIDEEYSELLYLVRNKNEK